MKRTELLVPKRKVPHPYLGALPIYTKRDPKTRPSLTGFGMTDIMVGRVLELGSISVRFMVRIP